jgi:cobalt-zinc-cadmium efflux system membrane fusion protein
MKRDVLFTALIVLIAGAISAWLLIGSDRPDDHADGAHDGHAAHDAHGDDDNAKKGPHGGRLLEDDGFAIEITIFETGVPPQFHVYAFWNDDPVPPDQVTLDIELKRLGGAVDQFSFTPEGEYLRGSGEVEEPHSFDVTVTAAFEDRQYHWSYPNYEGRTQIPATMAEQAGIKIGTAGPATIRESLRLTGRVQADPDRLSHVRARFPGVIQSLQRSLGDTVKVGDVLATVQSNESLQTYSVKAPIAGAVIKRDVQVGEATGNEPMFVIADGSQVWVELDLFSRDLTRVSAGQNVTVESLDGRYRARGVIDWISPLAAHASQSVGARVPMNNAEGNLRLGQFVRGTVEVADHPVPLAVKRSALQRFRDHQVVFARFGDTYEVRMLELGRANPEWVEVLGGLAPGTEYVTTNSYLIKADIEKSGASHDH